MNTTKIESILHDMGMAISEHPKGGGPAHVYRTATQKLKALIEQTLNDCLPEKQSKTGELFSPPAWDRGYNACLEEVKQNIKKALS